MFLHSDDECDDEDEQMFELVSEHGDVTDSSVQGEEENRDLQKEEQTSSVLPEEDVEDNEHKAIIEDIRLTQLLVLLTPPMQCMRDAFRSLNLIGRERFC